MYHHATYITPRTHGLYRCTGVEERYALVVGGSRGIGRATVLELAKRGYGVALTYNTREGEARRTVEEAIRLGAPRALTYRLDASSWESVTSTASRVTEDLPWLNVLVYSAGILQVGRVEDLEPGEWDRVLAVNLSGAFYSIRAFLPLLKRAPWASIVAISSIAGQTGNVVAGAAFSASKAGLIGLVKRLAVELAEYGIRVNAVAPSFVETDMVRGFIADPESRRRVEEMHPLGFILDPVDVARAVVFLAEPEWSRGVTGHVLQVNGGRLT